MVEDTVQPETPCGYIQDNTWDLQVGCIRPYLLLGKTLGDYLYFDKMCMLYIIFICVWMMMMMGQDILKMHLKIHRYVTTFRILYIYYIYTCYIL